MSTEKQARKMLTAVANTAGGFDNSSESFTAGRTFVAGADPSVNKSLVQHHHT
jgi:hypothetical protein